MASSSPTTHSARHAATTRRPLSSLVVGAVLSLVAGDAGATEGIYLNAYGARSAGMAGATLASGDDANAQIINPASLGWSPPQLDLGLAFLHTRINFKNQGTYGPGVPDLAGQPFVNDVHNSSGWDEFPFQDNNILAPMISASYRFADSDVHLGPAWLRNLTFGGSLHLLGGDAARFRVDEPVLGPDTLARTNIAITEFTGSLAYRIRDWLSFGATLQGVGGRMRLAQPVTFDSDEVANGSIQFAPELEPVLTALLPGLDTYSDLLGGLGADEATGYLDFSHTGIELGVGGRFGVTVKPRPWISLAVAYQTRRKMTFKGDARVDFTSQINAIRNTVLTNPDNSPLVTQLQQLTQIFTGSLTPESIDEAFSTLGIDPSIGWVQHYDARIPFELPQQVDVGLAVRPIEELLLEVDYTWIDWSSSFQSFRVDFSNGSNANVNTLAGTSDVPFALPIDWEDQHVIRVGASWSATDRLTLRAGYSWGSEPIRGDGAVLTIPAAGFQTVALGGTFRFTERLGVSVAANHSFRSTVRVQQSNISSFQADSKQTTSEWGAQAQLEWRF